MDRTNIITLPNEHLRTNSKRVRIIDEKVLKLIDDMAAATLDWEASREHEVGVALAAVQVDRLQRVIIIREDFNDKSNTNFTAYIDPEIVKYEGEIEEDFEGCLSIKDVYGKVLRYTKIRMKALTIDGKEVRLRAEGFLARVIQHEIDHTKGKLFVDHIQDKPEAFYALDANGKIADLSDSEREKIFKKIF